MVWNGGSGMGIGGWVESDLQRFVRRELDRPRVEKVQLADARSDIDGLREDFDGLMAGFGSVYPIEKVFGDGQSVSATADLLYVAAVRVFGDVPLSGVGYQVGSASAGNVRSALYDSEGARVANRTSNVGQAAALAVQNVDFSVGFDAVPGLYFAALIFSSGSATFLRAGAVPAGTVSQPGFATPSSISPPDGTSSVPSMWVY